MIIWNSCFELFCILQFSIALAYSKESSIKMMLVQSISVIRPAVLAGEIGPYKQIGPVSSTVVERESKYTIS